MAAHRAYRVRASGGTYAGGFLGCTTLGLYTAAGFDVVRAGAAIASTNIGNPYYPSNVQDGSLGFWTTGGTGAPGGGHWIGVDFGADTNRWYDVVGFAYQARSDATREDPQGTTFEWSDDVAAWNSIRVDAQAAWTAAEVRQFGVPALAPIAWGALVTKLGLQARPTPVAITQQTTRLRQRLTAQQKYYTAANQKFVSGVLKELGVAIGGKKIAVFDEYTHELLGITYSAGDGTWSVDALGRNKVYVIAYDSPYNALIFDNVSPV